MSASAAAAVGMHCSRSVSAGVLGAKNSGGHSQCLLTEMAALADSGW